MNLYGAGISAGGLTRRMTQSDLVAQAVELDMVEAGWQPTADTYLDCVPKVRILEAVREAKGEGTAQLLDHLKKCEMATEAERLLKRLRLVAGSSSPSRPGGARCRRRAGGV